MARTLIIRKEEGGRTFKLIDSENGAYGGNAVLLTRTEIDLVVEDFGRKIHYYYPNVSVWDDSTGGSEETFANVDEIIQRLAELGFAGFNGPVVPGGNQITVVDTFGDLPPAADYEGAFYWTVSPPVLYYSDGTDWIFQDSGSGSSITVVANYSALPAPATVPNQFYWAESSQGTSWLPGSLGGSYYNSGMYYSNGAAWTYMETPYQATQAEVNTGSNTNKFVTPSTFAGASKWNLYALLTGATFSGAISASNLSGTNTGNETTTTIGALINGAAAKTTPVDNDMFALMDSAASNIVKKLSWANMKAAMRTSSYMASVNSYTLLAQTAPQKIFNVAANGAFNAKANTLYSFRLEFGVNSLPVGGSTISFQFLGTAPASFTGIFALGLGTKNADTPNAAQIVKINTTAETIIVSSSTIATAKVIIMGRFRTGSAGTVIPAMGMSAGVPANIEADAGIVFTEIGSSSFTASPDIS